MGAAETQEVIARGLESLGASPLMSARQAMSLPASNHDGCDLAAGEDGLSLVDSLAALTGADVAASTDDTGTALLGGDWELEYTSGSVETAVAISTEAQASWVGLLAIETVADDFESGGFNGNIACKSCCAGECLF